MRTTTEQKEYNWERITQNYSSKVFCVNLIELLETLLETRPLCVDRFWYAKQTAVQAGAAPGHALRKSSSLFDLLFTVEQQDANRLINSYNIRGILQGRNNHPCFFDHICLLHLYDNCSLLFSHLLEYSLHVFYYLFYNSPLFRDFLLFH